VPARWFRIAYAENALRRRAQEAGLRIDGLTAEDAVGLALGFYRDVRAQHTRIDRDDDGLLWQWGPEPEGRFGIDLTRQLIRSGGERIVQLSLTLLYPASPELQALGSGNAWCFDPAGLEAFERELRGSAAYRAVADAVPVAVTLRSGPI